MEFRRNISQPLGAGITSGQLSDAQLLQVRQMAAADGARSGDQRGFYAGVGQGIISRSDRSLFAGRGLRRCNRRRPFHETWEG